ncbi:MAG TPA: hypothetical protein VEP91_06710 [Solirubrobacterales bacterium]|nr:hypothetical protein [Solirubrobacterales bacterium]
MTPMVSGGGIPPDDRDLGEARTALTTESARLRVLEKVRQTLEGDSCFDSVLDPQDQKVLRLRCGAEDGRHYALGAIGLELGMDADGVGEIEKAALRKLKKGGLLEND